jgi:hypothetical protein
MNVTPPSTRLAGSFRSSGRTGRHVPPTTTAEHAAVLGRDDGAEAVPLQLEGPARAGGQWSGASQHRFGSRRRQTDTDLIKGCATASDRLLRNKHRGDV